MHVFTLTYFDSQLYFRILGLPADFKEGVLFSTYATLVSTVHRGNLPMLRLHIHLYNYIMELLVVRNHEIYITQYGSTVYIGMAIVFF